MQEKLKKTPEREPTSEELKEIQRRLDNLVRTRGFLIIGDKNKIKQEVITETDSKLSK